jgi:hypothetical protein
VNTKIFVGPPVSDLVPVPDADPRNSESEVVETRAKRKRKKARCECQMRRGIVWKFHKKKRGILGKLLSLS